MFPVYALTLQIVQLRYYFATNLFGRVALPRSA